MRQRPYFLPRTLLHFALQPLTTNYSSKMATMAGPTTMSKRQMGNYLDELRNNRPSRPSLNGTRSPPPSTRRRSWRNSMHSITSPSFDESSYKPSTTSRSSSRLSFTENGDSLRWGRESSERFEHYGRHERTDISRDREESRRVSRALEQLDSQDEEAIIAAARAEAEELMWRYNNGGAPYRPPKDVSEKVEAPQEDFKKPLPRRSLDLLRKLSFSKESPRPERPSSSSSAVEQELKSRRSFRRLSQKFSFSKTSRRRSSNAKRNISGEVQTEPFPNENQRIFEDAPQDVADIVSAHVEEEPERQPLHVRRNPFARARQSVSMSSDKMKLKRSFKERTDGQQGPPLQGRDESSVSNQGQSMSEYGPVEYRDGKELRSDDIRAATSMRKKDRSLHLPSPSAVSDKPERPIVSFDPDWKPPEITEEPNEVPVRSNTVEDSAQAARRNGSRSQNAAREAQLAEKPLKTTNSQMSHIRGGNHSYVSRQQYAKPVHVPDGTETQRSSRSTASDVKPAGTREQAAIRGATRHFENQTRSSQARQTDSARTLTNTKSNLGGNIKQPEVPTISCTPAADENLAESNIPSRKQVGAQAPIPTISCTPADANEDTITPHGRSSRGPGAHDYAMAKPHWTPGARDRLTLCSQCALAIAGRSVSAAGARFHPECFTCHHCGEALECVAFYPEPAEYRAARVERNELRAMGEVVEQPEGTSEADDADDSLRFFCHLDFHEFFSPRCKTCKTPIEGQVIVACGAEYHPGHFFCAQCGDPFNPSTPFVEKDGYAWCVNCHTNRYAASCRKCRRPITNMVLNALGTEWHEDCFRCMECDGKFTDGRYFLRGDSKEPVCFACEERRLKA